MVGYDLCRCVLDGRLPPALVEFLFKEHPRVLHGLVNVFGNTGVLAVQGPRIVVREVLAKLGIEKDMWHTDEGRNNVAMQLVSDHKLRFAMQLETGIVFEKRPLVISLV